MGGRGEGAEAETPASSSTQLAFLGDLEEWNLAQISVLFASPSSRDCVRIRESTWIHWDWGVGRWVRGGDSRQAGSGQRQRRVLQSPTPSPISLCILLIQRNLQRVCYAEPTGHTPHPIVTGEYAGNMRQAIGRDEAELPWRLRKGRSCDGVPSASYRPGQARDDWEHFSGFPTTMAGTGVPRVVPLRHPDLTVVYSWDFRSRR